MYLNKGIIISEGIVAGVLGFAVNGQILCFIGFLRWLEDEGKVAVIAEEDMEVGLKVLQQEYHQANLA